MGVGKSTFAFTDNSISINGGSTTINITRDNQSYSHKLSHGYGDLATLAVGTTSYKWTPTADSISSFFKEIPNQKSRLIDVYLDTYNGSTTVGRDVHALTVTLSEATGKPSLSNFAINDTNTTAKGWDVIVIGKSVLSASQTATAKYGASIAKTVYTYGSNEYSSITDLIASLPLTTTPKSYTIGCKTTDSRGFTTTASLSKSCAKYEAPTIDSIEFVRCDEDGNETEVGTKVKAIVKGSWASIGGKNTATLKIGYKLQNGTSYTEEAVAVTNGMVNAEKVLSATLAANSDYLFSVSLTDDMSVTFSEDGIGFSNSKNIMYVSADGEELILGSSSESNITIGSDTIKFNGQNGVELLSLGLSKNAQGQSVAYLNSDQILELNSVNEIDLSSNIIALTTGEGGITFNVQSYQGTGQPIKFLKGVNFSQGYTFTIPTLNSGNCNSITDSGKYYIGNSGSNRPEATNGWLECMKYSTDYCAQTYTTYNGRRYYRYMQASEWGVWKPEPFSINFTVSAFSTSTSSKNVTVSLGRTLPNTGYNIFLCTQTDVGFGSLHWLDYSVLSKTATNVTIQFWNENKATIGQTSWAMTVVPN